VTKPKAAKKPKADGENTVVKAAKKVVKKVKDATKPKAAKKAASAKKVRLWLWVVDWPCVCSAA
jgi:hypothetical protein